MSDELVKGLYKDIIVKHLLPSSFSLPAAYLYNTIISSSAYGDVKIIDEFDNKLKTYSDLLSQNDINIIKDYLDKLRKLAEVYFITSDEFREKAYKLITNNFPDIDNTPNNSKSYI